MDFKRQPCRRERERERGVRESTWILNVSRVGKRERGWGGGGEYMDFKHQPCRKGGGGGWSTWILNVSRV